MQPQTEAGINSVVVRARGGELTAAADEAETLLNAAREGAEDDAAHISEALHRQLSPHALADGVKTRVGVSIFFSPTAKLPPDLKKRLDKEKAALETFFERLIAAVEVLLGPMHAAVVALRHSLIAACDVMEDHQQAVRACEQALAIAESHPDPGQESALGYRRWLSRLYREASQFDKADAVYDSITPCRHLQPLLDALRASGARIRHVGGNRCSKRFMVDAALDCEELIQRLGLPDCVQARVEDFSGPHDWGEYFLKGLVCEEDNHGIFGPSG